MAESMANILEAADISLGYPEKYRRAKQVHLGRFYHSKYINLTDL